MILFLDTADVLGITVIFADELKSSSPFYDPTSTISERLSCAPTDRKSVV